MKKVILNKDYGGFDVSYLAHKLYAKKKYNIDEIFAYNWSKDGFIKVTSDNKDGAFTSYLTEDFGDFISFEKYDNLDAKVNMRLDDSKREDSTLIEVVEELGDKASGPYGKLVIVEIPDDLDYVIDNYDGIETLHQKVQEW